MEFVMPQRIIQYKLGSARRVGDAHLQPDTVLAELRIVDPNCTPEWLADAIRMGIVTASTVKSEHANQGARSAAEAADNRATAEAAAAQAASYAAEAVDTRAAADASYREAADLKDAAEAGAREAADLKSAAEAEAATAAAKAAAAGQAPAGPKRPAKDK